MRARVLRDGWLRATPANAMRCPLTKMHPGVLDLSSNSSHAERDCDQDARLHVETGRKVRVARTVVSSFQLLTMMNNKALNRFLLSSPGRGSAPPCKKDAVPACARTKQIRELNPDELIGNSHYLSSVAALDVAQGRVRILRAKRMKI